VTAMSELFLCGADGGLHHFCQVLYIHRRLVSSFDWQLILFGQSPDDLRLILCQSLKRGKTKDKRTRTGIHTRRIRRFIWLPIFFDVDLSNTSRKTFQKVSKELLHLIPGSLLPFLPRRKLRAQSKKLYRIAIDKRWYSSLGSFLMKAQNLGDTIDESMALQWWAEEWEAKLTVTIFPQCDREEQ
jgi:hypothetical protein